MRGVLGEMRREWTSYLFQAPGLILFAIFVVYALITSFILSFQQWDLIGAREWVGLDNYKELLFQDHDFHEALVHTAYFVVGTVIPATALGLGLALLLNSSIRGLGLFRTAYYLPSITPLVICTRRLHAAGRRSARSDRFGGSSARAIAWRMNSMPVA